MPAKEDAKKKEGPAIKIMPGNSWLKAELTKYFGYFGLFVISVARVVFGLSEHFRPAAA